MSIQSTVRYECEQEQVSVRSAFDVFVAELDAIDQEHELLLQDAVQILEERAVNKLRAQISNPFQHGT
ncbi:MAG: hypothetical protein A2845_00840 [Candidatus Lloydbacteria bacterium RIFCSPHIGHO2_01_FULL_49_22]|uniref:Uncharacterized protein n=1 Tax=Candidatus Lloydbacteria bacterium RIFCSPHIGHO2_01_FULL_49_22 TaxID=1798658 RepID=A0A1G2D074_9BACT|nr:MAG: hypothetical protein A2845_00840 [Candidatus Lloydbacteria bacterium RIFCSPHIGHO2_01_FULL_49_22]OGZ09401.1 MAG: hypothetical protein A3C14_05745 [Candidatus Lloydbacteria bacterium RIFCSPHIGHO2_02_FULL_50_18]